MNPLQVLAAAARNLRARKGRTTLLVLGMALGTALCFLLLSLTFTFRAVVLKRLIESFPATQLEVRQQEFSVFVFRLTNVMSPLNREVADKIRAIPGVRDVLPQTVAMFPSSISGEIFGSAFQSDCGIFGIPRALVANDIPADEPFAYKGPDAAVPAVISTALLEMYNTGYAMGHHLPKLDAKALRERHFYLHLGRSIFAGEPSEKTADVLCRVVGLSDKVTLVGVSVPMQYVGEWHRWYWGDDRFRGQYNRLIVNTDSPTHTDAVAKEIEKLGLSVVSGKEISEKIAALGMASSLLIGAVVLTVAVLTALGLVNVMTLSVAEQTGWMGLLRAVGARRTHVLAIFLLESAMLGLLGAAVGCAVAHGVMCSANDLALKSLPEFPFKPTTLFVMRGKLTALLLAGGTCLGLLAGLLPALRAAAMRPAEALRRG